MADPLSIAASVAGLLSVAGKIYTIVSGFITSVADAPDSARDTLAAVDEMRMVLTSVRQVMDRLWRLPQNRKIMIHVCHLVITFRESIRSFSELEEIVSPAAGADGRSSKWDRVKWVVEEEKILRSVRRLELHKTSLSLMLNILQCETDLEARECLDKLHNTLQKVMDQNQALLRRLEEFGFYCGAEDTSTRIFDDDQSTIQAKGSFSHDQGSSMALPVLPRLQDSVPLETAFNSSIPAQDFEIALEQTRVYMRVRSNESDVSFTSSTARTNAWSMLSELSLNDISVISVIALPISLEEINSIGPQLTFAKILSGTKQPGSAPTELGRPSSRSSKRMPIRRSLQIEGGLVAKTHDIRPGGGMGKIPLYTLMVLGDDKVGKTVLTNQFCLQHFVDTYDPTIKGSSRKQAVIDREPCMLQVFDGQEHSFLQNLWIRESEGFVLVYSITGRSSILRVKKLHHQILAVKKSQGLTYPGSSQLRISMSDKFPVPIMLVGNKADRVTEREVSTAEGFALARELGCEFLEVSAKQCINVEKAFYEVVRMVRRQQRARSMLKQKGLGPRSLLGLIFQQSKPQTRYTTAD